MHVVVFHGAGSGTYDLTWEQEQVCLWMENSAPHIAHMNLGLLIELERPTTVEDVQLALQTLIERHEALRSRLLVTEAGRYQQVVCATGSLPIDVHPCTDWGEPQHILQELKSLPFTVFEWPLRIALIIMKGAVTAIAICVSHIASDGWGMKVISRDIKEFLSSTPEQREAISKASPRPLIQPREQAAAERSRTGSSNRRAQKIWSNGMAHFPNDRFPVAVKEPEAPRFPQVTMESRTAARDLETISARYDVSPHAVVIGALSLLLSELSGLPVASFRLFCANRTTKESQNSVGTFFQIVPVTIDVSDLSFRAVVQAAWKASLDVQRVGARDPRLLSQLTESVSAERGVAADLECFINLHGDSEFFSVYGGDSTANKDVDSTRFHIDGGIEVWEPGKFYVDVFRISERLVISFWVDTALFSREQIIGFLKQLELIISRVAVSDEHLTTRKILEDLSVASGIERQDGLTRVDGCWVDLDEIQSLLVDTLSPRAVQVFLKEEDTGRTSLTAYLVTESGTVTPADAHGILLSKIEKRRFVMTPHWYVMCETAPSLPASQDDWTQQKVISQGSGRPGTE
ncbi:condensation domain-containing protein [Streptomyces sp. BK205]|nr:condensation domain-containing protein [Streptomyces sp. BK205]